jgi:hypothetical protein
MANRNVPTEDERIAARGETVPGTIRNILGERAVKLASDNAARAAAARSDATIARSNPCYTAGVPK